MKPFKRQWKEPINGVTAFFTEESFTRVLGSVSLEEKLAAKFEYETHSGHSTFQPLAPFQAKVGTSDDHSQAGSSKKMGTATEPDAKQTGSIAQKQKPKAQRSSLSSKEQRRYLELFQKYLMSFRPQQPSPTDIKELTEFESLQLRVSQEQAAYLQYTEQVARSRHFDYNHLLPAARKYVNEKLSSEWRRVDHYPRYYSPDTTLPLETTSDPSYSPTLLHERLLVELGTFPKVFLPDLTRQTEVPTHYDKVNKRFPSNRRKTTNSKAWNHEACSRDTNCELLALRHGCQVVTCGSALRCLVDNHAPKFTRDWEIPIIIRQAEHDYGDISTKQKIVYIDKPFASKDMTNREKNALFHKYALKAFITQPAHTKGHRPTQSNITKKDEHKKTNSTNPFDNDVSMEDLETFGSFDFGKTEKKPRKSFDEDSSQLLASLKAAAQKQKAESLKSEESKSSAKVEVDRKNTHQEIISDKSCTVSNVTDGSKFNCDASDAKTDKVGGGNSRGKETPASKEVKVPIASSSGGDTSQEEALVIDIPELGSPTGRTTRSRTRKDKDIASPSTGESESVSLKTSSRTSNKTKSGQAKNVTDTSDDENDLVIDMGDNSSSDTGSRKTRSKERNKSEEFSVPKRVLRSRKSSDVHGMGDSETDHSPEAKVKRKSRSRSGSGQRSRTNSESMAVDEDEGKTDTKSSSTEKTLDTNVKNLDKHSESGTFPSENILDTNVLFSPSKVDNIMVKTSNADLNLLQSTVEGKEVGGSKGKGKRGGLSKAGLSPLDSILHLQEKMLPPGRGRSDQAQGSEENLSELRQPEEHNVSYNLWNFSGLTLLLRSSCHGQLRDLSHKSQAVCIVPKLEYQAKFGVEQVTLSEVARDWITCYVKPHTRLVRGRINGLTSELMKLNELELSAIVNPSLSFVPGHALASLHSMFLKLTELPAGQYLLSHKKGENSCQLLKSTENKRGSVDLKFSYMGFGAPVESQRGEVLYIPIDPTVLLPVHRRNGRVPCTFEPPDYVSNTAKKNMKKKRQQKKKQWPKRGNVKKT